MGTLGELFARLKAADRRAFIPYVTGGHPSPDAVPAVLEMLSAEGADLIEFGVPFSDPLADGPTIQRAAWQAVERGVDLSRVLGWTSDFTADHETPVVLFSYLNPILRYGPERFVEDARSAGAAGLLLTDLPVGEDPELEAVLSGSGLDLVRLVAPTTPPARIERIVAGARGFIYYVSRTGVTGERERLREALEGEVAALRRQTDLPIAVGFGISTGEQARRVAAVADGVVVGSALVRTLAEDGLEAASELARTIRSGIDAAGA